MASGQRIDFRFDRAAFELTFWPYRLPYPVPFRLLGDEAKGWLDTTYLSPNGLLRISKGNKVGNPKGHLGVQACFASFHLLHFWLRVLPYPCTSGVVLSKSTLFWLPCAEWVAGHHVCAPEVLHSSGAPAASDPAGLRGGQGERGPIGTPLNQRGGLWYPQPSRPWYQSQASHRFARTRSLEGHATQSLLGSPGCSLAAAFNALCAVFFSLDP